MRANFERLPQLSHLLGGQQNKKNLLSKFYHKPFCLSSNFLQYFATTRTISSFRVVPSILATLSQLSQNSFSARTLPTCVCIPQPFRFLIIRFRFNFIYYHFLLTLRAYRIINLLAHFSVYLQAHIKRLAQNFCATITNSLFHLFQQSPKFSATCCFRILYTRAPLFF